MDRSRWRKLIKDMRPTWVVPDKGLLNGCVCLCVCVRARWYYPDISLPRSEEILREDGTEGCFLIRDSRRPGFYTLSLFTKSDRR